jgi:hypothetical protein
VTCTGGDGDTEFTEDAASGIDACGAVGEVGGAETMKGGEGVLAKRLDRNRLDIFVAKRFEQTFSVGTIGFVTNDVGMDGVGWEKDDGVAELAELASPVVGRATGFENDSCGLSLGEEALESRSGESVVFIYTPGSIGDGDFKNGLREIDGDGRVRLHSGFLLHESGWFIEHYKRLGTL